MLGERYFRYNLIVAAKLVQIYRIRQRSSLTACARIQEALDIVRICFNNRVGILNTQIHQSFSECCSINRSEIILSLALDLIVREVKPKLIGTCCLSVTFLRIGSCTAGGSMGSACRVIEDEIYPGNDVGQVTISVTTKFHCSSPDVLQEAFRHILVGNGTAEDRHKLRCGYSVPTGYLGCLRCAGRVCNRPRCRLTLGDSHTQRDRCRGGKRLTVFNRAACHKTFIGGETLALAHRLALHLGKALGNGADSACLHRIGHGYTGIDERCAL